MQTKGASVPDQALAVPVQPVARLDPSGFDPSRREWAERIADQFDVDDPAAIDAIEEGLARGRVLAGGRAKEALKEMLNAADWLVAGLQAAYFRKVPVRDFEERFARYDSARELAASAIEAATAGETRSGSTAGESAVGAAETPKDPSHDQ